MGVKITGLDAVLSTFRAADRRYKEAAGKEIENGAKDIAALARKMAPVDQGDLVSSIRAQRVSDPNSTKWRVKVGGIIGGRDVNNYALFVHERFQVTTGEITHGEKGTNPGKRSREKAKALGIAVGGDFLGRAFRQLSPDIKKKIQAALKGVTNDLIRKGSKRYR